MSGARDVIAESIRVPIPVFVLVGFVSGIMAGFLIVGLNHRIASFARYVCAAVLVLLLTLLLNGWWAWFVFGSLSQ